MNGATLQHSVCLALVNVVMLILGYILINKRLVAWSWISFAAAVLIIHVVFLHQSPLMRMLAIVATTFTGMKIVAVATAYKNEKCKLIFSKWLLFSVGWAGMRAQPFETPARAELSGAWAMIRFGVSRVIAGLLLVILARKIATLPIPSGIEFVAVSVILLVALSLILHFGVLSISAGIWQLCGVNTYYLFRQPIKAASLTEFWSKRWNIAFSEMTAIAVYRPLKNKAGSTAALILAFAFSGLLHELALSVPVSSGYGLPMLYFMIQAVLVLVEKGLAHYNIRFLTNSIIARIWTLVCVVAPAPLLFQEAFIKHIVWVIAGMRT